MNRRAFLKSLAVGSLLQANSRNLLESNQRSSNVNTVTGSIPLDRLGLTLMHEHVLVDFIGADKVSRNRYRAEEVFRVALPFLQRVRSLGCCTLVDCTPAYLGRDPTLLKKLSVASGLNIITNTGYYGASNDKYLPQHAYQDTAEQLAASWTREFREGIERTGIRPGIMKISVDKGSLSEIDAKLVRAAALTHLKTGLTIASHTEDGSSALEELNLLHEEGVAASAFIWVHAHVEPQVEKKLQAAERGCWIELDGISEQSLNQHAKLVKIMIDNGFVERTLISQDSGWYNVGEPGGGKFNHYETLFTRFIPALRNSGTSEKQIHTLLIENPRRALETKIRRRNA
jgi:phosphotriesterase-related protein